MLKCIRYSKTQGFVTTCVWRNGKTNGFNAHIYVSEKGKPYRVYALKQACECGEDKCSEDIYSPYSKLLDLASVRQRGKEYLQKLLDRAYAHLRVKNIRSVVNRNVLVADRVQRNAIASIALVEHIDVYRMQNENMHTLVNEVYTTLGLNQVGSYRFSV